MRVVICGSRSIKGEDAITQIDAAIKKFNVKVDEVISGGAEGVDTAAIEWAKRNNIDYVVFPANWKKWNKAAGYKRNEKMAWYADQPRIFLLHSGTEEEDIKEDFRGAILAIWNGSSKGTANMIEIGKRYDLKVFVSVETEVQNA